MYAISTDVTVNDSDGDKCFKNWFEIDIQSGAISIYVLNAAMKWELAY